MQGQPFIWKGKTLLSGIDPVRRAERTADAVSVTDRTLYFCPSPLYGYGLERFLERLAANAPNSALLCIEADTELYELSLKNIDPSLANNQMLRITNFCESGALCALVKQTWGSRAFRRVEPVRFSGGWQLYPELYNSLAESLRMEIATDWSNALTLTMLGRLYIRNALRNLALVPRFPSIERLTFGEEPVLVLGAGPSLDTFLDGLASRFGQALQAAERRAFKIICVDTCLGALRDRNIAPDLAVILESQHWNLRDFTGCRGWNVPAAIDLSALPQSGHMLGGGMFLFATMWAELTVFQRLKAAGLLPVCVPPLGSVGLTAVEIALRLTRGTIITAGIDFSFTLDKYHARSTPGHRDKLAAHTRFRSLLNAAPAFDSSAFGAVSKAGLSVRSNPAMRNYRSLFEREFAHITRLFDVAGSGLPLGLKSLSEEEAFAVLARAGEQSTAGLTPEQQPPCNMDALAEKLKSFLSAEKSRLAALRNILTGGSADQQRLNTLIDECDYLWAHFPDCAGCQQPSYQPGRRSIAAEISTVGSDSRAISFLKRLRAEIDPALALLERTLREVEITIMALS
ncbi:MAG: DUF115 domain-containing protein [Treponema sp.]|jgi:hypothetical protein|nr:DUF115 domain-containing protein [Treponema sp.]